MVEILQRSRLDSGYRGKYKPHTIKTVALLTLVFGGSYYSPERH